MLVRFERQGDDIGAIQRKRSFMIIEIDEPVIVSVLKIPEFSNGRLIMAQP
jgi:hypothetical protein